MNRNFTKWTIRIFVTLFIVFLLGISAISLTIGWGVKQQAKSAQQQFPGDRVEALIAMVDCASCDLRDRDHAVWALGMLADRRALPVLERYYTGNKCDHSRDICQYELKKALKLVRDGRNPSAFLWNWMA